MGKTERRALCQLSQMCRMYLPLMIAANIFGLISPYVNIYMSAEIVNEIAGERGKERLITLIIIAISANFIIGLLHAVSQHLLTLMAVRYQQSEEMAYTEKLLALKYADLENPEVLDKRRRISAQSLIDRHGIQSFVVSFTEIINQVVNLVISIGLSWHLFCMLFLNRQETAIFWLIAAVFILAVITICQDRYMEKKKAARAEELSETMLLINRINNESNAYNKGKDIRLYRLDVPIMQEEQHRLELNSKGYERYRKFLFVYGIPHHILNPLINALIYVTVYLGIIKNFFAIGGIVKYAALMNSAINALQKLFGTFAEMKSNRPYLEEYLSFFELEEEGNTGGTKAYEDFRIGRGENLVFEFRNVWFRYPGAEKYALKDMNLTLDFAKRSAVVGLNGSGKTTFIKLIARMYSPTKGTILLNGKNIEEYGMEEYRKLFSVVFQDFTLLPFTLGQNVASGTDYEEEYISKLLHRVDFGERLAKLPQGLDTYLYQNFDEKGIEISGGEAQKIALARALYRESPVLILDEPTASLDALAEFRIYSLIQDVVDDRGILFISHRLSVCQIVDDILVFEDGKIVQRGAHKDLVANKDGLYNRMWEAQSEAYV